MSTEGDLKQQESEVDWYNKCLCHCHEDAHGDVTQFTAKSWKALHESAEQRRDQIYEALAPHFQSGPRGGYHRRCYQTYTNKTFLVRLQRHGKKRKQPDCGETPTRYVSCSTATSSNTTCDDEDNIASARRMRSRTSFQATDLTACIFCQTTKKKYKDKHLNESLSLCLTEQASATLLEAARIRSDERLLLAIEHQDLIAIEVRYHRSCYSTYTHKQNLKRFIEARNESPVAPYSDVNVMETVLRETEIALFQEKRILQLSFEATLFRINGTSPKWRCS